jgi:hypothetical protein
MNESPLIMSLQAALGGFDGSLDIQYSIQVTLSPVPLISGAMIKRFSKTGGGGLSPFALRVSSRQREEKKGAFAEITRETECLRLGGFHRESLARKSMTICHLSFLQIRAAHLVFSFPIFFKDIGSVLKKAKLCVKEL